MIVLIPNQGSDHDDIIKKMLFYLTFPDEGLFVKHKLQALRSPEDVWI